MAIKKNLLEIVQNILSDMDSEEVNTISDTVEAMQVAQIVETTFYNMVAARDIPEHESLLKLTAMSDTSFPTHFQYPTNVKHIEQVSYDVSSDGTYEYRVLKWEEPLDFLRKTDNRSLSSVTVVEDKSGGTKLRIFNDRMPTYYTSFDDNYIVMDAHDSTIDTTLTQGKSRAFGITYPVFSQADDYTPDIDATMHPYLLAEAKSTCMSLLKGGTDMKVEQSARRQKSYVQNDMYKTKKGFKRPNYGKN
tara:strand:- start:992 stop:1735 length:744 start_codon:yes stop_codon:yes gene_type:complete